MRLIDADALLDKQEALYMKRHILFHGVTAYTIESSPTIDPETLPIVKELMAQLDRVTAERDAAIKDMEALMWFSGEGCKICNHCTVVHKTPYVRYGCDLRPEKDCTPKWRGIQKEQNDE